MGAEYWGNAWKTADTVELWLLAFQNLCLMKKHSNRYIIGFSFHSKSVCTLCHISLVNWLKIKINTIS
jgi:hypothetical protein